MKVWTGQRRIDGLDSIDLHSPELLRRLSSTFSPCISKKIVIYSAGTNCQRKLLRHEISSSPKKCHRTGQVSSSSSRASMKRQPSCGLAAESSTIAITIRQLTITRPASDPFRTSCADGLFRDKERSFLSIEPSINSSSSAAFGHDFVHKTGCWFIRRRIRNPSRSATPAYGCLNLRTPPGSLRR
jgi:hypothetical protein